MQPAHPNKSLEQTLETMFTAKYPWLLRWALHFAHNDPAAAEDLVQETLVRILMLKGELCDLENIEPLLYTHLRYASLTERRRGRNQAFQSLAAVDFDTLSISLRTTATFDQIEVQNELRKILTFLLWRRRAAKFANMFLLRYYHEFSHEEIARICLVSRHAVDIGLARSREELKSYLAGPQQIRILGRGPAPEYKPQNTAVPSDKFANDMMLEIFRSSCGACPGADQLELRYRSLAPRSLDNDLISHLVSCGICLDRITRLCKSLPPAPPSAGISTGLTRRTLKAASFARSDRKALARIFDQGLRRMRETWDHHPSDLVIALNAEVVAVRDISSPRAVLKVETRSPETLELIEIFSEQGLLLLMLPIAHHPPMAPPELRHEVALSGERSLSLCVRFTGDGAVIEATYLDPHFALVGKEELALAAMDEDELDANETSKGPAASGIETGQFTRFLKPSVWRRFLDSISRWKSLRGTFIPAAIALVLATFVIWFALRYPAQHLEARNLLRDTMHSEARLREVFGPGVVHQQVEIRSTVHTLRRNVYRDLDGRRRPKQQPLGRDEEILKARLAEAQCDWDDPLSAANFEAWRDNFPHQKDTIERNGTDLVTLTTNATSGPVLQQSITIRLGDLHPVARNLVFRDHESIQVAELSYEVVSWGPASELWFEASAATSPRATPHPARLLAPSPQQVTEDQLDLAELGVLVAMQELRADTERLRESRTSNGVLVTGVVESDSRKLDITAKVQAIPHVTAAISSYRDIESKAAGETGTTSIKAVSIAAGESPLDKYCESRRLQRDRCRQSAHQILSSSTTLVRESRRLSELEEQFPSSKSLTPTAKALLDELTALHFHHLAAAIHDQEDSFPALQLEQVSGASSPDSPAPGLSDLVQNNQRLAAELVYASGENARDADLILMELAASAQDIRLALSRISQPVSTRTDASPVIPTPIHE